MQAGTVEGSAVLERGQGAAPHLHLKTCTKTARFCIPLKMGIYNMV